MTRTRQIPHRLQLTLAAALCALAIHAHASGAEPVIAEPSEAPSTKDVNGGSADATTTTAPADSNPDPANANPANDSALDELLAKVKARYKGLAGVRTRFYQESTYGALGGAGAPSKGEAWFARPDRTLWIYEVPEAKTVVMDGQQLWFHQPAHNQVLVSEVDPAVLQSVPTSFLSGGDLTGYDVTLLEQTGEGTLLELLPQQTAPFQKLRVRVATDSHFIDRITIFDTFGNLNEITFDEIDPLTEVDPALFTFEIPPDTAVVKPPTRAPRRSFDDLDLSPLPSLESEAMSDAGAAEVPKEAPED